MSKLSIFDIVSLAKAGYKAADIEKLTSIDIPDDAESDQQEKKPESTEQPPAENSAKEPENDKAGSEDKKEDDVDYKSLYEQKCAELEKVQQSNVRQNQPTKKPDKTLDDIVRSFM